MWLLVLTFSKVGIIEVMDIPVLMTVNDSWTSSCLSATQDSNHKMMDYKQFSKHYTVLTEKMGQIVDFSLRGALCLKHVAGDIKYFSYC